MLALTLFIPLNAKPNIISCLWIVKEFACESYASRALLEDHSLADEVFIVRMGRDASISGGLQLR